MKRTWLLLLALLISVSACRGFREVPLTRIELDIDRGDVVRVTDHENASVLFRVESVTEHAVVGADVHVEIDDIQTIELEGYHGLRAVGGLVEFAIAVLMLTAAVGGALAF